MKNKKAVLRRKTKETDIIISRLKLDGRGDVTVKSGMNFFDHMLTLMVFHSGMDLKITAKGDLNVDHHHSVEDVGIVLGAAINSKLGDKKGIRRYGESVLPMDETLVIAALDFSGRPGFYSDLKFSRKKVGDFDTELFEEFFRAFTNHSGMTLHLVAQRGKNTHHLLEAAFKATGRAMRAALTKDRQETSTKGVID